MNYLLAEAEEPIQRALERLVAKAEDLHPFVVITKVGRPDIFVQFATHKSALLFDVPALGIVLDPTTPKLGSVRAVLTLTLKLGVALDQRVLIHEKEDEPPRGEKIPLWKRLFA